MTTQLSNRTLPDFDAWEAALRTEREAHVPSTVYLHVEKGATLKARQDVLNHKSGVVSVSLQLGQDDLALFTHEPVKLGGLLIEVAEQLILAGVRQIVEEQSQAA